ncbi:hypothetical protein [Streptomyces sp. WMMC897]|uniref:hypothetical protein n=1 Tax=Streptomyces sp. WMMC897 TaxID=3014782 RepID=UPI0022B60DE3|nr:hypothetical protein [Streptomyces sp. WMMC897]MCZ7414278.1 hypothetical protein [Streptomyces sp. WMMC897]
MKREFLGCGATAGAMGALVALGHLQDVLLAVIPAALVGLAVPAAYLYERHPSDVDAVVARWERRRSAMSARRQPGRHHRPPARTGGPR